jgi:hypothetical protein
MILRKINRGFERSMKRSPTMTKAEYQRFVRNTVRMFQGGYSPNEIIKWALSAQSGFGRFWARETHAARAVRYVRDAITIVTHQVSRLTGPPFVPWRKLDYDAFFTAVASTAKEKIDDLARRHFDQP